MKIDKELMKGSSQLLVLHVVSKAPLYGYEIAKQIKILSAEIFSMGEGTLYPVLHKLEKLNFLESYWQEVEGRRRKYYGITSQGLKALGEKTSEWKEFSDAVNAIVSA